MSLTDFEFRRVTNEEMRDFFSLESYVFADNRTLSQEKIDENPLKSEMTTCAFHKGQLVATGGGFPFKMRFNGHGVFADGVTAIGTEPAYRRRGLVRRIITERFEQARNNGQFASILWASFAAVYQRFGYGLGSQHLHYAFDPRFAQLQSDAEPTGYMRRVSLEQAKGLIPGVHRRYIEDRTMNLHRHPTTWDFVHFKSNRHHFAIHFDEHDNPDGYISYGLQETEPPGYEGNLDQRLNVRDFVHLDVNAFRALWGYLLRHDLVFEVSIDVPTDDPARHLLREPRVLRTKWHDGLWFRVVDVEELLSRRHYGCAGDVTIDIPVDRECPWNVGKYRLQTDATETHVAKHQGDCDLSITVNGLASLLSGNISLSRLHANGIAQVNSTGKLRQLDAMFSTKHAPFCNDGF